MEGKQGEAFSYDALSKGMGGRVGGLDIERRAADHFHCIDLLCTVQRSEVTHTRAAMPETLESLWEKLKAA